MWKKINLDSLSETSSRLKQRLLGRVLQPLWREHSCSLFGSHSCVGGWAGWGLAGQGQEALGGGFDHSSESSGNWGQVTNATKIIILILANVAILFTIC